MAHSRDLKRVADYVRDYHGRTGQGPTGPEIAANVHMSKGKVHVLVEILVARGVLTRRYLANGRQIARSLKPTPEPEREEAFD